MRSSLAISMASPTPAMTLHSPLHFIPLHPLSPNRSMHHLSLIYDVIHTCNICKIKYTQLTKIHETAKKTGQKLALVHFGL